MSEQQRETKLIDNLFENIKKGVASHGLEDFNKCIEKVVNEKKNSSKISQYALEFVASEYNTTTDLVLRGSGNEMTEARGMVSCLLFFNAKMSIREISKGVLGRTHHLPVTKAINRHRNLDSRIKRDREYKEKYDKIEKKILKKINDGE